MSYLFADFSAIACRKHGKIWLESTRFQNVVVSFLIVALAEENIVSERRILDPGLLRDVRNASSCVHFSVELLHFAEHGRDERRLAGTDLPDDSDQFARFDFEVYVSENGLFPRTPSKRGFFNLNRIRCK